MKPSSPKNTPRMSAFHVAVVRQVGSPLTAGCGDPPAGVELRQEHGPALELDLAVAAPHLDRSDRRRSAARGQPAPRGRTGCWPIRGCYGPRRTTVGRRPPDRHCAGRVGTPLLFPPRQVDPAPRSRRRPAGTPPSSAKLCTSPSADHTLHERHMPTVRPRHLMAESHTVASTEPFDWPRRGGDQKDVAHHIPVLGKCVQDWCASR